MATNPYATGGSGTYNYYDPTSSYGGGTYGLGQFAQTGIGKHYLENNKQAAFTRWLADNGYRDFTGEGEFARQQFGKIETGYEAAAATNPDLNFGQYLQQSGGNLRSQFNRLTPEQRGEQPNVFGPRARYIPR